MKTPRRLFALFLALLMILSTASAVFASESKDDDDATNCIIQMLNYYAYHRYNAETDIARLNAKLAQTDPELAKAWANIMDYWAWADEWMSVTPDILPDGLPEDDSLCIVVLGYALNPYGTMQEELVGRLEVALDSAAKYPNAYILCTGGGTASRSKTKTEAGQMAAWLEEHGIAEERIIIEDESLSTVQNAQYSCRILASDYPQVRHVALISSDYHVPRGCVYFNTQMALMAYEDGTEPLDIVGNAGYLQPGSSIEDLSALYSGIAQIAGINFKGTGKPTLSRLTDLEVDGEFTYEAGTAMTLTVTAYYTGGFSRDVTADAVFSGVDMSQPGEQLLTVTYEENGREVSKQLLVDVTSGTASQVFETLSADAPSSPTRAPAQADTNETPAVTPTSAKPAPILPFLLLAALLALLALLLRLKIKINK